jgi:hypothetical protein
VGPDPTVGRSTMAAPAIVPPTYNMSACSGVPRQEASASLSVTPPSVDKAQVEGSPEAMYSRTSCSALNAALDEVCTACRCRAP